MEAVGSKQEVIKPLIHARCSFEMVYYSNKPYVFGGLGEKGQPLDSIEFYDAEMTMWV